MATVGRSNIEITADTSRARRSLGDFFREAENGGRNLARMFNTLDPFSRIERDARNASGGFNNVRDAAGRLNSDLNNLGGRNNLDELNGDLSDAERNMDDLHRSTDDVGDGLDDASRDMRDFGNTAERETSNAEGSFGKMADTAKKIGGVLVAAFAVDKVVEFGTELAATAGAAEASKAQFSTVFGDMEGEAAKRLSAIGGEASILENRMKDSFTKIAAFAKTGGMDTASSMDLADRSMRAVADSAAFYDRSLEDVTESLQSYLKGNFENDAALGLSSTETTRNAAANKLYGKSFKDLAEDQKQLTLLQMVEDANKLTGALGQASRESDGWENVVGNMTQAWTDFKGEIGAPVLKVAVAGIKGVTAAVQSLNTEAIGNGIGKAFDYVSAAAVKAKDKLGIFMNAIESLKTFLSGEESAESVLQSFGLNPEEFQKVITAMNTTKEALSKVWKSFQEGKVYVEAVFALFNNQDGTAIQLLHKLGLNPEQIQAIMDGVDQVKTTFTAFLEGMQTFATAKAGGVISAFKLITDGITAVFNYLMPIIQPALAAVLSFASGIIKKIAAFWISDGASIVGALQNIGKIVGVVFGAIFKVIQFVMPAVLAIVKSLWGNVKGVITGGLDLIMGAIKVFSGLFTGDFGKMWEGVKQMFFGAINFIWNFIQLTFFGKILGGVKAFVLTFRTFFVSLWQGIVSLFKGNLQAAQIIISTAWQTILRSTTGAFKAVWQFLKDIFNSIKSIVTGFITGVRTVFSTGWSFIRNTTSTVFNAIWNTIKTIFNTVKNFIQSTISWLINRFVTGFTNILNTTRTIFNNVWNFIKSVFTTVKNFIQTTVSWLINRFTTGFGNILNATKTAFNNIWNTIKQVFTTVRDFLSNTVSTIFNRIKNTWNSIKDTTSRVFGNIFNTIKNKFTDIVNLAKSLPGKIGDGIGSMASKVTSGVTKVINKLATTLGKGVNGVIGGINTVLGKIGVDDKNFIDKWTVPQYAQGTKGAHPGGPAMVNDGKGDNAGPEMIINPDGTAGMLKGKNVVANFQEGTQVISAKNTRKLLAAIPKYDSGTGPLNAAWNKAKDLGSHAWDKVKGTGKKVKDLALDVFDYIKEPGKLLDVVLDGLGIKKPSGSGFIPNMAKGAWDKVKSGAVNFVKGKLADFGDDGGPAPGFGGLFGKSSSYGYRMHPILKKRIFHNGADYPAPPGTLIKAQAAGKVIQAAFHAIRGNFVRIQSGIMERIYQHNSRNLVSTGDLVRKGQGIGTVGSTGRSTGPHLHYEVKRNGKNINPQGFFKGGIVKAKQLAWIAEKGMEAIIPLVTNRAEGIDLWKQVGQHFGFDTDAIFNQGQDRVDYTGSAVSSIVNKVAGANGSLATGGSGVTLNVEVHPAPVYLDGEHVTDILFPHVDSRLVNQSETEDYFKGRTK